jgi:hypothetical protein
MMMGAPMHNLGEGCSKDAGEGSSTKRPRERHPKIGHFHDDVGPTHFAKFVMAPGLETLPIPPEFRPCLGTVPEDNHPEEEHRPLLYGEGEGCEWHNLPRSRVG